MTDNSAPDAAVQIVMQDLRERGVIFADDAFFRAAVNGRTTTHPADDPTTGET